MTIYHYLLKNFTFLLIFLFAVGCSQPNKPLFSDIKPEQGRVLLDPNLVSSSIDIWSTLDIAVKADTAIEIKITALLKSMTLEKKVAQMIQPEIRDISVEDMRKYGFGSYLNGGGALPNNDKQAIPSDWIKFAEANS